MRNVFVGGLASLFLPLGAYASVSPGASYQRSQLSANVQHEFAHLNNTAASAQIMRELTVSATDELDIVAAIPTKELVIIDAAVPDKQVFYRGVKPGVDIVEIDSSQPGLAQLKAVLKNYKGLTGLHIVSHAEDGVMLLGNSRVDSAALTNEKDTFASLNAALVHGADLVFYGCDLASGDNGGELLDIIRSNTHIDVAASNNKTGNAEQGGDWDLEIRRGNIEAELAFTETALKDFSAILAPVVFQPSNWTVINPGSHNQRFTPDGNNDANSVNTDAQVSYGGKTLTIDGEYNSTGVIPHIPTYGVAFGFSEKSITLSFTDGSEFKPSSIEIYSYQGDPFTITTNNGGSLNGSLPAYTDYTTHVIDLSSLPAGATSMTITNNSWEPFATATPSAPHQNGFIGAIRKITFDSVGATNSAPTDISLSNNSVNQSGGTNAVVGTLSSTDPDVGNTFTYALVAGAGDTNNSSFSISGNSLLANDSSLLAAGNYFIRVSTTDNSNATFEKAFTVTVNDNVAPVVNTVSVPSSATYSIGQNLNFTVNASENLTVNTGGGTPRIALTIGSDTRYATYISGSGTSALLFRYTVLAGDVDYDGIAVGSAIDLNSGTIRDAAGNNITTTLNSVGNTSGVLVSSVPIVTDGNISISGATGTAGAYKVLDVVTATWDNTGSGDNNTGVTGVTVDFSQFGGGPAVVATNTSGVWTATYQITAGAIDLTNRNISVTATSAGGSTTASDSTNATVDNVPPTVTDGNISISGATGTSGAYKIGDTVEATWNNTAGGDNNIDTISAVTVNFTDFGGGMAVAATNSSGTWTATYTIVSGVIDANNRNVTVTARDNAGNERVTSDTTNATVDNIAPAAVSIVPAGGAVSGDTTVDFIVDFNESVNNVSTDDFTRVITGSAAGTISGVSASTGSQVTVSVSGVSGSGTLKVNLNGSTNIVDDVGNEVAAYTGGTTHTVNILTAPDAPTIGAATAGDGQVSVAFTAPSSNGGSAITGYTVTSSPGGITGGGNGFTMSPITVNGLTNGQAYTFTVTATNGIGTSTASGASGSATPKANQTITFANPGARNFGTTPTLGASSTSGLAVTFTSSTSGVCTITPGGELTFVTAGSCSIDADQTGNSSTNAATTVSQTFTVNAVVPGVPTIGTATAGTNQANVAFVIPATNGGATITNYTVTSSPGGFTGTGAGSPITVTGLDNGTSYTFTVTATNSAGTGGASAASNAITPAAPQTITFTNPGAQSFGTSPTLAASSSAGVGYVVTFTSATTGVCTISSSGELTFVSAGSCTINANQAGDNTYLPAPQESQTFTVNAVAPAAPTIGLATAGDTQAMVAFTAPTNTGGATITGYTVTSNPGNLTGSGATSPISVSGLTNGQAYTFTVTAITVAGTGFASAASNSVIPKTAQVITFNDPGAQNFGAPLTLSATTNATGLTPVFTSSTTGVCTITSVGVVTFVAAGSCTINANQAGDGTYLPAPQVSHTFAVNAVLPGVPTIGTASAGNTQATVTFTAPASNGGAAITGYTVTANPGGATASGSGSPITFTGLTNGTSYTFTVRATNSVGTGAASGASNAVTPSVPPNAAPVIAQGGSVSVTMSEDGAPTPFALTLTASDADNDPLTWSISGAAQHGSASVSGGVVSYTPTANYHGSDSFVVRVSDGTANASTTVNVTITSVNDAPVITGTPSTSVEQDVAYSFTPTASDVDVGDVLTFSITNKPSWASFSTSTGALTGTPANADAGVNGAIVISVSDGTVSTALPAFDIEVISTIDPLQPVVTAPATLDVDATALFTPITLRQLLALNPDAAQGDVDAAIKAIAKDGVSGNDCCTTTAEGLTATNALLLAPGRHEVKWKATNAVGVSGEAMQVVNIKPLVSLSKSQIAVRGSNVEFRVLLNGPSPAYPLSVPYVIDATTTATGEEHNLASGTATFTQSGQVEVAIPVTLAAVTGFSDSQLVIALGGGINAGATTRHVIDIRAGNVPPVVSLAISQGGINTSLVTPSGGPVTVTATVTDANQGDTHTFDWSATSGLADTDGNLANASRTFDPAGLTGSHQLNVTVTDSGGASVRASAYFRVISTLPVLSPNTDSNGNGISDELEGTGDSDDNGIPDYLDNMPSPNILPQQGDTTNAFLIECDPGVRCGLGLFARSGSSGGVQILDGEVNSLAGLVIDPAFEPVGGIFDFAIRDLPTPGQSVRVVIPQREAIPANAVYRKYQRGAWVTFVSDADNAIHSAQGNPGYCPPPGSVEFTPGLTVGHMCVQLTIEDGGPNDDDGLVNSAVVDPGAVSEAKEVEPPVEPPKPPVDVKSKGGGSMSGLWLLLLGGLVFLKRVIPARLAVIFLALFSINTQAMENTYLRLDVFTVDGSQSKSDFAGALDSAGHDFTLTQYDESRSGYQIALGYQWNELTYSEVGYLDLGDVKVDLTLAGDTDLDAFARDFADNYPITATGATLVQGVSYKAGSAFTLSAEAGAFIWKGEVELDKATFDVREDDGIDPLLGVKADFNVSDALSVGVSGRRIFFGGQDVDLYAVTSSFRF